MLSESPPADRPDLWKATLRLRKEGRVDEALDLFRAALRRGELDAEGIDRAGRAIHKELAARNGTLTCLRVLVLGQCTTSWLKTSLTAVSWAHGVPALVEEGEYDNVLQEI